MERAEPMDEREQPAADESAKPKRTPVTRQNYHSLIEQRMAQAAADGLFDRLPGHGQPQKLDDDALVPPEDRAAFRLLKANGFAPPWIEVQREIEAEQAAIAAWRAQINTRWPRLGAPAREAARAEHRRKLDDLQRMIMNYNLRAPRGVAHLPGLRIGEELRKLGEAD